MQLNHLPIHPRLRHPLTGQPLRAVYVDKHGTPRWPILGGSEGPPEGGAGSSGGSGGGSGDGTQGGGSGGGSGSAGGSGVGGAGAGSGSGGGSSTDNATDADGRDLGFPKDTPVAEMSYQQQAAYHRYHSRKHEQRSRHWRDVFGDRTPEQAKSDMDELDELRRGKRTESENAVEDARKEEREKTQREYGTRLVAAEFRAALKHLEGVDERDGADKRDRVISGLNLADYLTSSGDVDTAKVKSYAADIAPADTGAGGRTVDYGGGRRDSRPGAASADDMRTQMEKSLGRRPKQQA